MKDTVRHLHRKLQHNAAGLPPDLLQPTGVDIKYAGHVGFPELADSLAFEPVQSLLAVGTQDGRVKLIGRPGVEVSLRSSSRSPTKYLGFLKNKGAVLRVTQEGDIQLFSIVERRLSASTWLQGDTIAAVALLPNDPYILLGCESGCVRVVALLDGASRPAEGAAPAVGLTLQPYQVLAHDLDAKGPVVALDVTRFRGRPLLLVVHKNSGALVWDVRAEKIMCAALDDENEISKPTSACWVGERANCFAVGYDDGSILLYGVPPAALQEDPFKVSAPGDARLLMTFRVANLGTRAAPIKSLTFVAGEKGDDWLMVLGGQAADEPDMLTKLPLVAHASGKTMPWFGTIKGFALVPCKGSLTANDDPAAVMVLTEGGQLVVHDLRSWQPMPLTLPFQELPPISVARFVPTVSLSLLGLVADALESAQPSPVMPSPGSSHSGRDGHRASRTSERSTPSAPPVQHALTLDKLVRVGGRRGVGASLSGGIPTSAAAAAAAADAWPLHGGEPAQRWGAGPGSVPSAPGAAATAAAAGTAAAAAAAATAAAALAGRHPSALYFTGHRDGRVRVWDATTQVPTLLMTMPASGGPAAQERLRPVTALEVCPFSGIVLVGHQAGEVRLYQFTDSQQTVHRMNVDETGVPYDNVGAQPPGFQYVMRYSTHAADITGACLATKLKLAAVADESGTISVLDLMQPGLLWSTKALQRPIRHLAVGCHVIPGPEKKGEKGSGGAAGEPASGGETERLVLFAAGDDSTLLMLSLEKGEILEKPLRPKNASRTLAMELLDYNGTPVPPPRGVMTFPWANNNTPVPLTAHDLMAAAEAADASMRQLSLSTEVPLPNFSPRLPGSSSGVLGTSNGHSVGGVQRQVSVGVDSTGKPMGAMLGLSIDQPAAESSIADSLELRELPSDDEVDSAQVAAAAAVVAPEADARQQQQEQQQKGAVKPKFRLPKGFLRAGMKRLSSAADPTDLPSPTTPGSSAAAAARQGEGGSKPTSPTSSAPVSSQQSLDLEPLASGGAGDAAAGAAFSGLNRVTPTETVGSATLSGSFSPQHSVPRSLPSTKVAHIGDLVDYPYLIDAEPTPAAYVLLCTEDYVRVYSTENVRLGDRTTERKASEDPPLVAAGIFMSVHGPGVVTVSSDGALAVRTVPGLDCIYRLRLDHASVLGFKWSFGPDASVAAATSACSLDGQLMLAGPSNEIARVLVVQDCVEPTGPGSTYDAALAEAASAALAAQAAALAAQRSFSREVYVVPEASAAEAAAVGAAAGDMSKRGLGRFFNTVKGTATGVLDTASKTAATVVQGTMTELDRGMRLLAGGEGDQQRRELPSLPTLFSTPVEAVETENDDIDYMTDEEEPALSPTSSGGMSSRAGLSTASSAALSPRSAAAAASAASAGAEPSPRPSTAASAAASAAAAAGAKATAGLAAVGAALRRAGSTSTKERQQEGKNQTKDRQQEGRKSERGELMQGATTTAARPEFKSGATHMRTTSSIREAYGRPRHTERSQQVKGIMEENRRRLQERGEKLANLEQRTAQMQDDASDFASLAKQLESSFANRKWWQV